MYSSHWGLRDSPFGGSLNPLYYFNSTSHDEALARMQFLVDNRRRLGIILGARGGGKSLLLEMFAHQTARAGKIASVIQLLGLTNEEFLCQLAYELGEEPDPRDPIGLHWKLVTDRLTSNRFQETDTVLLLDDADEALPQVLTSISRLVLWEPTANPRLTVFITAHENKLAGLGERLLGLCDLRIDVRPWEFNDTAGFLNSSLAKAGRSDPAFTDSAIMKMQELTHGSPRQVRKLAELALLAGAGSELETIDADTVQSVSSELNVELALPVYDAQ